MRTPSGRLAARQRLSSRRAFLERWPYRSCLGSGTAVRAEAEEMTSKARAPSVQGNPSNSGVRRHCELMRGYLDFEALGDRLAALRAVVGDAAQDVELGHVSRRTATRDVVADGPVAIDGPRGPVPAEAGDIDQVPFIKAAVAHVVGIHEHDGAQALQPAVAVVVGVDRRVELVVRADRGQHQPPLAGNGAVWERREPELGAAGGRQESAFAGWLRRKPYGCRTRALKSSKPSSTWAIVSRIRS